MLFSCVLLFLLIDIQTEPADCPDWSYYDKSIIQEAVSKIHTQVHIFVTIFMFRKHNSLCRQFMHMLVIPSVSEGSWNVKARQRSEILRRFAPQNDTEWVNFAIGE